MVRGFCHTVKSDYFCKNCEICVNIEKYNKINKIFMPIIYTYPTVSPQSGDLITLSDEGSTGSPTKSATAKSIANLATSVTLASLTLVATPPANAASTGTTGMIATDTDYIYVCTATNTWKRVAITTW